MTNIYYKSTYRTTMTNNINIMQWICTGNYSMTSDESVAHINYDCHVRSKSAYYISVHQKFINKQQCC